ncbi:hypothetical protein [Kitasatospora sp. NPDC096140]|uniref:hypothetical protein n=1 Tax=Kitasatospora sp. NPDC096140 TaxID=3155425 RepID=UPI0033199504
MSEHGPEQPHVLRTVNRISGDVQGPVIQADVIIGDIHLTPDGAPSPGAGPTVSVELFGTSSTCVAYEGGDGRVQNVAVGVKVLVEGLTAQAVVLRRMRPVVDSRRPARPPVLRVEMLAALETRGFTADLDAEPPTLGPARPGAPDFPFTVTNAGPELFAVAPGSTCEVEWHLELDWTSAGRSGTVVIDRDGRPFTYLPVPVGDLGSGGSPGQPLRDQ